MCLSQHLFWHNCVGNSWNLPTASKTAAVEECRYLWWNKCVHIPILSKLFFQYRTKMYICLCQSHRHNVNWSTVGRIGLLTVSDTHVQVRLKYQYTWELQFKKGWVYGEPMNQFTFSKLILNDTCTAHHIQTTSWKHFSIAVYVWFRFSNILHLQTIYTCQESSDTLQYYIEQDVLYMCIPYVELKLLVNTILVVVYLEGRNC